MTDAQAVSLLIGDPNNNVFSTDDINEFLLLANVSGATNTGPQNVGVSATSVGSGEYFLAASMALNAWAAMVAGSLQETKIGDYQVSQSKQVQALQQQAQRYFDLYVNTPAWAIVETDESDMNALIIIRNYVLRSNP